MKFSTFLTKIFFISFALFLFSSCEKKTEIIPDEPFEILGTWTFDQVITTAPILGDYTDSDPTGTIIFNEDGTGSTDYSFNALGAPGSGIPINSSDSFSWVRTDDIITMTINEDETRDWTIVNAANDDFQVTWTQDVSGVDAVDFQGSLKK